MFKILISHFDDSVKQELRKICLACDSIHLLEAKTIEKLTSMANTHMIDCFFFCLDQNSSAIRGFISQIRQTANYAHTPFILFSTKMELLVSASLHLRCCEFFLLPMTNDKKEVLIDLIQYYDGLYKKIHPDDAFQCRISTPKGMYNIPYNDILYVESALKKTIIHTKSGTITLPLPLYRLREILPHTFFVQTHRSFIVNIKNAVHLDKSKEPWIISFFNYEKTAFVSRSFKKDFLQIISSFLDFMED
ncbi:MAG: LytTR family transcriptional regulator [Anaerotignum sp.]|nr:LytTR family transcriptional regulator [Anaerotignum sp.]